MIVRAQDDGGCSGWDVGCKVGEKVGDAGENFMQWVVETAVDGLTGFLDVLGTAWFKWPAPNVFDEQSGLAPAVSLLQGSLAPFVVAIAALSFLFALGKMVWTMRAAEARSIMRLLIILAAVTGAAAVTVQTLLAAGDAFAPWIIERASGEDFNATTFQKQFFGAALNPETLSSFLFVVLILAILMTLATLAQVAFMIVRAPLIITMLIFLPLAAASTATEEGMQRFRRAVAFLLAAVLYKPVAAIIYATGITLIRTSDESNPTDQILNMVYGFIIISFAALALPALIKFFMPIAAIGSSNAFSGGAASAATGAVVMGGAMLAGGAAGGAATGAGASAGKAGGAVMPPPSGGSQAIAALGPGGGGSPSSGSTPPRPSPGGGGTSNGPSTSGGGGGTGAGRLLPSSGPEARAVGGSDSGKSGAGSVKAAAGSAASSGDSASVTGSAGGGGTGGGAVVGGDASPGPSGSDVSSAGAVSSGPGAAPVSGSSSSGPGAGPRPGVGSPSGRSGGGSAVGSPAGGSSAGASSNASGAGNAGVDQSPFPIAGARARATAQRANATPPAGLPGVRRAASRGARHVPEGVGRAAVMAGAGVGINDERPEGAAPVGEGD